MIEIKNLVVTYGQNKVLDNINKSFEINNVHGIVGLNGAGETTLFNVLAQVIRFQTGEILFNQKPLSHTQISFLETESFFYSRLTGKEHLNIFPKSNPDFKMEEINSLLKVPLMNYIENYSTGERKKLALLAILKQDKPIIILDEPFNGLDLESTKVLEVIIARLKQKGKTIFISSHILEPLFGLCDYVHYLVDGNFQKTYLPHDFKDLDNHIFGKLRANAEDKIQKYL